MHIAYRIIIEQFANNYIHQKHSALLSCARHFNKLLGRYTNNKTIIYKQNNQLYFRKQPIDIRKFKIELQIGKFELRQPTLSANYCNCYCIFLFSIPRMENIYKIKIKSTPDPRGLYPSERRYSASIVLGLSIVHLCLALTAILMAILALHTSQNGIFSTSNETALEKANTTNSYEIFETSIILLSLASYLSAIGAITCGLMGLLAWKKWYIDANIKRLFFTSVFSTITSLSSFVLTTITIWSLFSPINLFPVDKATPKPNLRYTLTLNVLITCLLEFVWSCLSTKISYNGMKNSYPDDIVLSNYGGKRTVNTIHLGNKKAKARPPDILNHFEPPDKFSKFFPKPQNSNLPKEESNKEYQERVQKFLRSETNADDGS